MSSSAPAKASVSDAALAAVVLMTALQVVRIEQATPGIWMAVDYAIRIFGLAILFLAPPAADVPFKFEKFKVHSAVASALTIVLVLVHVFAFSIVGDIIDSHVGDTRLDFRPMPQGGLLGLDLTVGLALVAVHEEILFRRVARQLLNPYVGDGLVMIALCALIFGLVHWPHGLGNMMSAALFGAGAMLLYKYTGKLMPAILAHYLVNAFELGRYAALYESP